MLGKREEIGRAEGHSFSRRLQRRKYDAIGLHRNEVKATKQRIQTRSSSIVFTRSKRKTKLHRMMIALQYRCGKAAFNYQICRLRLLVGIFFAAEEGI